MDLDESREPEVARGTNQFPQTGIVECADDVIEALGLTPVPARGSLDASHSKSTACADPVLHCLEPGVGYDLDAVVELSGVDPVRLLPRLLNLELQGLLRRVEGGRFVRPT